MPAAAGSGTGLPWLAGLEAELAGQMESGQMAHALLIYGERGTGRRRLAAWLAQRILNSGRAVWPGESAPETTLHPNLHPAVPEEGKSLPVERIRELIDFMLMSAYGGGGRVAAIFPAESMRRSAANSLLKILEEPRPDSYLLLVAENTQPLPATIISRCRLLRVPAVGRDEALAWLSRESGDVNWRNAMRLAGGGPLWARELQAQGLDERARAMSAQLAALEKRRATPVEVARNWKDLPMRFWCDFLFRCAFRRIRDWMSEENNAYKQRFSRLPQEARQGMIGRSFAHLDAIMDCRRSEHFSANAELAMTVLLQSWFGGFCART